MQMIKMKMRNRRHQQSGSSLLIGADFGTSQFTNATFMFFCAIEEVLCSHLKVSAIKELSYGTKSNIIDAIVGNDAVASYWCLACIEAEE